MEANVKVMLAHGLHARPAAEFVKMSAKYPCSVRIAKGTKEVDAKSILGVMSASVNDGDEIKLIVSGEREAEAFETLKKYLEGQSS